MPGRTSSDFVEAVRGASDIVQVISDYVPLKGAGRRLKGLCPFHQEKTPSFSVDPSAQLFYCFGCQTGGDVFKFVQLYDKDWDHHGGNQNLDTPNYARFRTWYAEGTQ